MASADDRWLLLDPAPCGVLLVATDGRVLRANAAARALLGAGDPAGRDAAELLGVVTLPPPGEPLGLTRADGTPLTLRVSAAVDGTAVLYLADGAAQAELARREAVAATVRDAMIETDPQFVITGWNRAAETMYGWTPEEVVGRPAAEVLQTELSEAETAAMVGELAEHGHVLLIARQRTREGRRIEVEASVIELRDGSGTLLGYVAINRDVAGRRRLEERLRETRHLEVVGRLAGGVAHDLNSLLTAILGYADLSLAARDLPARVRPDLEEIVGAAERAGALTRQLLAFSRQQVLAPRVVDLNEVLAETVAARRRLAGKKVELVDQPAPGGAEVLLDPARFAQALLDIVANAGEAMPDGGRLTFACETDAGHVRLAVTDSGAGMDEQTRLQAFEPFFTTKRGHTGLGLSTVYGFIGQSGGRVDLESAPGRGTTVTLHLRRAT